MEIQPKLHHVQSSVRKENVDSTSTIGRYSDLVEKNRSEILTVGENAVIDSINKANKAVQGTPHEFNFKVLDLTGDLIVQILNKETQEIIHELPSEKFILLVEKLKELTVGAIIDEKG